MYTYIDLIPCDGKPFVWRNVAIPKLTVNHTKKTIVQAVC